MKMTKFTICLNVSVVFSTSQTAVANGISGALVINFTRFKILEFFIEFTNSTLIHWFLFTASPSRVRFRVYFKF